MAKQRYKYCIHNELVTLCTDNMPFFSQCVSCVKLSFFKTREKYLSRKVTYLDTFPSNVNDFKWTLVI